MFKFTIWTPQQNHPGPFILFSGDNQQKVVIREETFI